MGQYHIILNLDKREIIRPGAFGDFARIDEIAGSSNGMLAALAMLIYGSEHDGGGFYLVHGKGKYRQPEEGPVPEVPPGFRREDCSSIYMDIPLLAGRWAGDRVIVIGDYVDRARWWKEVGLDRAKCSERWSKRMLKQLRKEVKNPETRCGSRLSGRWVSTETEEEAFRRREGYYQPDRCSVYKYASEYFKDISDEVAAALKTVGMARDPGEKGAMRPDMLLVAAPRDS